MNMTSEQMMARIAELEATVERSKQVKPLKIALGKKGGVAVYGLQRFPVTLYANQWAQIFAEAENIKAFIEKNKSLLSNKE